MIVPGSTTNVRRFDSSFLDDLSSQAFHSPRLRQHFNIHNSFDDPCQRFLNAIEPGSYLQPTRHAAVPKSKLLVPLRGHFALVLFEDDGTLARVVPFGANPEIQIARMVEVEPGVWNTILSLAPRSVLLEAKAGPFDTAAVREGAPWAPEEGSLAAQEYAKWLAMMVERNAGK